MDPETTLRDAEAHLRAGERAEAADALADYWAWRRRGGYEPPNGDLRARDLARRVRDNGTDDAGQDNGTSTLADTVDAIIDGLGRPPAKQ